MMVFTAHSGDVEVFEKRSKFPHIKHYFPMASFDCELFIILGSLSNLKSILF